MIAYENSLKQVYRSPVVNLTIQLFKAPFSRKIEVDLFTHSHIC